jgi:hypothetical protein
MRKNNTEIFGNQMSCPKVDQINTHWLASKYLERKSTERNYKNEVLMKTEILVSIFGRTKTRSKNLGDCGRKTGKLSRLLSGAGSKRKLTR